MSSRVWRCVVGSRFAGLAAAWALVGGLLAACAPKVSTEAQVHEVLPLARMSVDPVAWTAPAQPIDERPITPVESAGASSTE